MPRVHERELKLSLCRQIKAGELSRSKAARDHGLSATMLGRWLTQYEVHGENAFQGQAWRAAAMTAVQRIEQLEEELRFSRLETALARQMLSKKKSQAQSESE